MDFTEDVKDRIVETFVEKYNDGFINNQFHYLRGAYDQAEVEYVENDLIQLSTSTLICHSIAYNTTQDESKLLNKIIEGTDDDLLSSIQELLDMALVRIKE